MHKKFKAILFITAVFYLAGNFFVNSASAAPVVFNNPLNFNTVEDFLSNFLGVMQAIIVTLALVSIVIGAILYVTSAGNEKRIEAGKAAIMYAMIGLAIGVAAPSILREIGTVIGWGDVDSSAVGEAKTLTAIASSILTFLLGVFGLVAMIMMVIGGIMYLTSAGDEDRIDTGKKIFKYSLIGTLAAMAAMVLVHQIAAFFV